MASRSRNKLEFGEFQTPRPLADRLYRHLAEEGFAPASIVEPTCGTGTFIQAAMTAFPNAATLIGLERNPVYIEAARRAIHAMGANRDVDLRHQDFFDVDWPSVFAELPEPILLIGKDRKSVV